MGQPSHFGHAPPSTPHQTINCEPVINQERNHAQPNKAAPTKRTRNPSFHSPEPKLLRRREPQAALVSVDPTMQRTQGINPGSFELWRCRESNPGPCRILPFFYVCSRAIAVLIPMLRAALQWTIQPLFSFPLAPVTDAFGESPSDVRPQLGDALG